MEQVLALSILTPNTLIWLIIAAFITGVLTVALGLHKKPTSGYGTGVICAIAFMLGVMSAHFHFL